jgi:hypothetical protein
MAQKEERNTGKTSQSLKASTKNEVCRWLQNIPAIILYPCMKYKILGGKPEQETPLGRCRGRWEDKISMDLKTNSVERCGLYSSGSG